MAQQNDKFMSELSRKIGDIHKLLFSDLPVQDKSRLQEKLKAEILIGSKRDRQTPQR